MNLKVSDKQVMCVFELTRLQNILTRGMASEKAAVPFFEYVTSLASVF